MRSLFQMDVNNSFLNEEHEQDDYLYQLPVFTSMPQTMDHSNCDVLWYWSLTTVLMVHMDELICTGLQTENIHNMLRWYWSMPLKWRGWTSSLLSCFFWCTRHYKASSSLSKSVLRSFYKIFIWLIVLYQSNPVSLEGFGNLATC